MNRRSHDQRPLFDPWLDWHELSDAVREHVLEVLTALYLTTIDSPNLETMTDDSSDY